MKALALLLCLLPLGLCGASLPVQEPVEGIKMAAGSCNTYLVETGEGCVLIDPGSAGSPDAGWIEPVRDAIRAILLTHGHSDHIASLQAWHRLGVPVHAQREFAEFQHYITRLSGFFSRRNAAQGVAEPVGSGSPGNYAATILPERFYDQAETLTLGNLHFLMIHTGGETPDQAVIWIPEKSAVFIGDNYFTSFPNLYTLRGTKPRWALDYVKALEVALGAHPEVVFPGHGDPIRGTELVQERLGRYRDAILYVHDATVKGMNDGKDVFTLMREISLPEHLQTPEFYGRVSWSVRGIYEGYAGWFDGNVTSMYALPASAIYPDLVSLAGGPDAIVALAERSRQEGQFVKALQFVAVVLVADERNQRALEVRHACLQALREASRNGIERTWLDTCIKDTRVRLGLRDSTS